jgi:glutamyl-tRNA reductase
MYCWVQRRPAAAATRLVRLLASQAGMRPAALTPHVFTHTGAAAVEHLLRVTSGLDSLALGECQIIGQVRDAFLAAAGEAPLGASLHLVFQHAIEGARRIRRLGGFDRHPSVAAIAVHVATQELGGAGLRGREVAVLGAGVTGKAAARTLAAGGAARIRLLNRSPERATALAAALGLGDRTVPATLDALRDALAECDAVVCATASSRPVVTAEDVAAALARRQGRPLVLVDIAVPRDVAPDVRQIPGVTLIDLDNLEARCALDPAGRRYEMTRVEAAVRAEAALCADALRTRSATPDIVALRRHGKAVRDLAWRRFGARLQDLSAEERAAVEQLTHTIVQQLLHGPTVALRRAGRRRRATLLDTLTERSGGAAPAAPEGAHTTLPTETSR